MARVGGIQVDNVFLQEYESLCGLECRSGRICSHQGTVEQRPCRVVDKLAVVFSALASDKRVRVVGRCGHHAQNLARCRLDGHYGSAFADHKRFGVFLQFYIEAQA